MIVSRNRKPLYTMFDASRKIVDKSEIYRRSSQNFSNSGLGLRSMRTGADTGDMKNRGTALNFYD